VRRSAVHLFEACSFAAKMGRNERNALPLTLSIAGHAIVLALLFLLVVKPSPPELRVKGGIEVALGQSSSQPEAALAPEMASQSADPSPVAALPPPEIAEPEPVIAATEPPPTPLPETLPPNQTERVPPPPHKPVIRQPQKTVAHLRGQLFRRRPQLRPGSPKRHRLRARRRNIRRCNRRLLQRCGRVCRDRTSSRITAP